MNDSGYLLAKKCFNGLHADSLTQTIYLKTAAHQATPNMQKKLKKYPITPEQQQRQRFRQSLASKSPNLANNQHSTEASLLNPLELLKSLCKTPQEDKTRRPRLKENMYNISEVESDSFMLIVVGLQCVFLIKKGKVKMSQHICVILWLVDVVLLFFLLQ